MIDYFTREDFLTWLTGKFWCEKKGKINGNIPGILQLQLKPIYFFGQKCPKISYFDTCLCHRISLAHRYRIVF
jgi:hypothetical protein